MEIPTSTEWSPRIPPNAFIAAQFTFLAIAVVAAGSRTFLRIWRFRRIAMDDIFLVLAVIFLSVSAAVVYEANYLIYFSTYVNLGLARPPADYSDLMLRYSILDNIATVMVWASIFSVKFSFVLFFKDLIKNVRHIQTWWWVVVVILCLVAPTCMFLGFSICPEFTVEGIGSCMASVQRAEAIYLTVTSILDIVTDVLVISVPLALLWKVRIDIRRKIALGIVLCLSTVMIVVAIFRVSLAPVVLPSGRGTTDTAWLFFWQNIEAATAVIMVSITAFRSMLGQQQRKKSTGGSNSNNYPKAEVSLQSSSTPDHKELLEMDKYRNEPHAV